MPIGPLMIEHRLIERMIRIAKIELEGLTHCANISETLPTQ